MPLGFPRASCYIRSSTGTITHTRKQTALETWRFYAISSRLKAAYLLLQTVLFLVHSRLLAVQVAGAFWLQMTAWRTCRFAIVIWSIFVVVSAANLLSIACYPYLTTFELTILLIMLPSLCHS